MDSPGRGGREHVLKETSLPCSLNCRRSLNPHAIPGRLRSQLRGSCLDQLAKHAEEVLSRIDSLGARDRRRISRRISVWWARAFAGQCRAALDELTLLAPSTILGIDEIPTLRELARIGNDLAAERITAIERLALQSERTQPDAV